MSRRRHKKSLNRFLVSGLMSHLIHERIFCILMSVQLTGKTHILSWSWLGCVSNLPRESIQTKSLDTINTKNGSCISFIATVYVAWMIELSLDGHDFCLTKQNEIFEQYKRLIFTLLSDCFIRNEILPTLPFY